MKFIRRQKPEPQGGRRVVLVVSDIHAGHVLGLFNPATTLVRVDEHGQDEDWQPQLSEVQQYMWSLFESHVAQAFEFAGDDEVVIFHTGDVTQGNHYTDGMIPGVTRAEQVQIATECLLPLFVRSNVKRGRLATGTLVHVPDCAEAQVARWLKATTGRDVRSCHHARVSVDGVVFDVAHHGPFPGSRDWLRGNVARYYLKSAVYEDRRLGCEPARVWLRGHYHDYVPETIHETWDGRDYQHDLVVVPSYCGLGEYARKTTRSTPSLTNGLVAFEIIDGALARIEPFKATLDLRLEETL